MIKRSNKRREKRKAPKDSARAKGDFFEQVTASLHQWPNVKVETNVFLEALDDSGRAREIDVLVSSQVVGHPVYFAIECKNERKPTRVGQIDEFIGKLKDVGIPTQMGIFVSASRYTRDAILRAQKVGIIPLLLKDTTEKLPECIKEAFQSVIYLLLTITNIQVKNDNSGPASSYEVLSFRNQEGKLCGFIPDLVWLAWQSGEIPPILGFQQISLTLPEGWLQIINGRVAEVSNIEVEVQVTGHVVTFPGSVSKFELVTPTDEVNRWQIKAKFDELSGTYPVSTFLAEEDLKKIIDSLQGIKLTIGRFPLPRIRWVAMYWPPSDSTMKKLAELAEESLHQGKEFDLAKLDLAEIEGTDMKKVWEPIIKGHPFAGYIQNRKAG